MKILVKTAAQLLGKSELFVRCGIKSGKLPIGTAMLVTGEKRYSYYVSPGLLAVQLGVSMEELKELIEAENASRKK